MNNESSLVLEVWEAVRDQLPAPKRNDAALSILRAFEEYGMERKDLQDITDEDVYLSRAFNDLFDLEEEEEYGIDEEEE